MIFDRIYLNLIHLNKYYHSGQGEFGNNGNKGVLHTPRISQNGASLSDAAQYPIQNTSFFSRKDSCRHYHSRSELNWIVIVIKWYPHLPDLRKWSLAIWNNLPRKPRWGGPTPQLEMQSAYPTLSHQGGQNLWTKIIIKLKISWN